MCAAGRSPAWRDSAHRRRSVSGGRGTRVAAFSMRLAALAPSCLGGPFLCAIYGSLESAVEMQVLSAAALASLAGLGNQARLFDLLVVFREVVPQRPHHQLPSVPATVAIIAFLTHWKDFFDPLIYLSTVESFPLSVGQRWFQQAAND